MNEETISKVLSGETDVAKMSHDEFVELLKGLSGLYFARVMNCVDGTGNSDKEWTALSSIFNRVAESVDEKPSGNSAAMRGKEREVLNRVHEFLSNLCRDARCDDHCSECLDASDLADDVYDLLHSTATEK